MRKISRVIAESEDVIGGAIVIAIKLKKCAQRIINNFAPAIANTRGGIDMIWQIIAST